MQQAVRGVGEGGLVLGKLACRARGAGRAAATGQRATTQNSQGRCLCMGADVVVGWAAQVALQQPQRPQHSVAVRCTCPIGWAAPRGAGGGRGAHAAAHRLVGLALWGLGVRLSARPSVLLSGTNLAVALGSRCRGGQQTAAHSRSQNSNDDRAHRHDGVEVREMHPAPPIAHFPCKASVALRSPCLPTRSSGRSREDREDRNVWPGKQGDTRSDRPVRDGEADS